MRLMIVGGSGAAGQALVRQVCSSRPGADIAIVSRTPRTIPGVRVVVGHYAALARTAAFRDDLAHLDAVVHFADGLPILQERRHAHDAALAARLVEATRSLAQAVHDASVPLFVHISSIKAICGDEDRRLLVEACEPRGTGLYGQTKFRLETVLGEMFAGSASRLVVLRNPALYGAGVGGSMARLLRYADWALPLPLGVPDNRRSLLSVRNLAGAITAILEARAAHRGLFHIHDGDPLSTADIVAAFRSALGRPSSPVLGPRSVRLARRLPLLAPFARRLYGSLELSDARFRRCFEWTPVEQTRSALHDMALHRASRRKGPH